MRPLTPALKVNVSPTKLNGITCAKVRRKSLEADKDLVFANMMISKRSAIELDDLRTIMFTCSSQQKQPQHW